MSNSKECKTTCMEAEAVDRLRQYELGFELESLQHQLDHIISVVNELVAKLLAQRNTCARELTQFLLRQKQLIEAMQFSKSLRSPSPPPPSLKFNLLCNKLKELEAEAAIFEEKIKQGEERRRNNHSGIKKLTGQEIEKMSVEDREEAVRALNASILTVSDIQSYFVGIQVDWYITQNKLTIELYDCIRGVETLMENHPY
ncbi:unnamed protein product [Orchesella dallaii]|uniref:Uncharacterized protein n=1 Tax=Orchesella dallaii TaxID=48710 RepID=A0ABP1QLU1_9HEXA